MLTFCDLEMLGFFYWRIEINCAFLTKKYFCDNPAVSVNIWVAEAGRVLLWRKAGGRLSEALVT